MTIGTISNDVILDTVCGGVRGMVGGLLMRRELFRG
jgi:hypothetical protein